MFKFMATTATFSTIHSIFMKSFLNILYVYEYKHLLSRYENKL